MFFTEKKKNCSVILAAGPVPLLFLLHWAVPLINGIVLYLTEFWCGFTWKTEDKKADVENRIMCSHLFFLR